MSEISLSLIQTFYHLGQAGSYSGAAKAMGLSHPAVANQIRRLERLIGEPLVEAERGARKLRFSARGAQLYAVIKPEFDIMFSRLGLLLEKQRPMLLAGMSQGILQYLISDILIDFRSLHPEAGIIVYERDTALADLVRQGKLDVFLAERHFGDPLIEQRLLGHYSLSLAYPAAWGAGPKPGQVQQWVEGRPFVSFEPGQTLREIATDYLGDAASDPVIATSSASSLRHFVQLGLGYSILPDWVIKPNDPDILVMPLPQLALVPIYFGSARMLRHIPLIEDLFRLCQTGLPNLQSPPKKIRKPRGMATES